ncbi:hypothetical protein IG604_21660, partial [Vibrio cholerae]|nr:hypothetical protein [Vibrio cholerae]
MNNKTITDKYQHLFFLLIEYKALPLQEDDNTLYLSITDINNYKAADAFRFATGKNIELVQADKKELYARIE